MKTTVLNKLTLVSILALFCASCSMDSWQPYEGEPVFVSCGNYTDYTIEDYLNVAWVDNIDPESISPIMDLLGVSDLIVRMYPIVYKTVDPLGRPTNASGMVFVPHNKKHRGVIDVMPFGYMENYSGCTFGLATEHVLAFMRYIVISPDFIDAGSFARPNTLLPLGTDAPGTDVYHPFMDMDNSGRVAYDMHIAAREFLKSELGIELPNKINIFGYSEGGTYAMDFHRWIDKHDPQLFVQDNFAGGGCYDLIASMKYLANAKKEYYAIVPYVIYGIDFWNPNISLDYTKIFKTGGPLMLTEGSNDFRQVLNRHSSFWPGEDMTAYLHENFFLPWTDDNEFNKCRRFMEYNNAPADPDWKPSGRIHLFHAKGDRHIPDINATIAYDCLKKKTNDVYLDFPDDYIDNPDPHAAAAIRFFLSCCAYYTVK